MRRPQAAVDQQGFDLNLLVALDALLAEKSVTKAGRRIHLSQSAMSGALARLRHALNDTLLVANRGGMTLTPRAESLVEPVRSILEQVHRTIIVNVPFDPASSRRVFTIAASDYAVEAMMWHPRLDRDAGHAWLRRVLQETAAALPAFVRASRWRRRSGPGIAKPRGERHVGAWRSVRGAAMASLGLNAWAVHSIETVVAGVDRLQEVVGDKATALK